MKDVTNERKTVILDFLKRLYCPVGKVPEYDCLVQYVTDLKRGIFELEEGDEKTGITVLNIQTAGRGNRETFKGYSFDRVNVETVGKKYSILISRKDFSILRIANNSPRITPIGRF